MFTLIFFVTVGMCLTLADCKTLPISHNLDLDLTKGRGLAYDLNLHFNLMFEFNHECFI